jgi:hypothetical protein
VQVNITKIETSKLTAPQARAISEEQHGVHALRAK